MQYPPTGSIYLCKTAGWAGRLIRLGTDSEWNHAAIAVDDNGAIVEATPAGVRLNHISAYAEWAANWTQPLTPEQARAIALYARQQIGRKYNWPAIGVFTLDTFHSHVGPFTRWADSRPQVICSELAVLSYRHAGLDPYPGKAAAEVSPGMLDHAHSFTATRNGY